MAAAVTLWMTVRATICSADAVDGPPSPTDTTAPPSTLEEVVVTAQKRKENILSVPMTVTAVSSDTLEQENVKDIVDLTRLVPGVSLQPTGPFSTNQQTIVIRGISQIAGSATTGVYIDDTPIQGREVGTVYPQIFDLQRVEVLEGPQGTLFGAGSEGGTVRFITPTPSLTQYSGFAHSELSYTDGGTPSFEVGVAGGGPIADDVAGFRASLWTRHDGGYIDRYNFFTNQLLAQDSNTEDAYVGRVSFLIKPVDRLTVTPAIFFQKTNQADSNEWWSTKGVYQSYYNIPQPTTERFALPSLSLEYQLPGFSVKSITSYLSRSQDATDEFFHSSKQQLFYAAVPDYALNDEEDNSQKVFTQELRFTSDSNQRLTWVGGVFYYSSREGSTELEIEPLANQLELAVTGLTIQQAFGVPEIDGDISYRDFRVAREKELAEYGDATFNITSRLKVTAGLRESHTQFSFNEYSDGPFGVAANLEPLVTSGASGEHPVTPKAGLSYDLDGTLLYATWAKGYRIGGANPLLPNICQAQLESLGVHGAAPPYTSDSVKSTEIGFKGRLANDRLLLTASLFKIDWSHIQGVIPLNTCAYSYTGNFGTAVSQGAEAQVLLRPVGGLEISGSASYTDAHYTQTVTVPGATTQLLVKDGDPLLDTPEWQATAGLGYTWSAWHGRSAYVRGDETYSGSYVRTYSEGVNGYLASIYHGSPIAAASLRVGLRTDSWDTSLFVKNLTNNSTPLFEQAGTVPGTYGFIAIREESMRPRTIGADFTYHF